MTNTALVVRGGWEGHEPIEATDLFIPHLEEHGIQYVSKHLRRSTPTLNTWRT
jgi:type 1 glutamine amidotransferase